jgi:cysteinyl-tRNA synthetase
MLSIYNTLTGKKEPFQSLQPKTVRMYVCGVTVYDYCHIGHARSALVFDVIRRYLEFSGYQVEFAKNFTDVDDKIIKRANERSVSCDEITAEFIEAYYQGHGEARNQTGDERAQSDRTYGRDHRAGRDADPEGPRL